MKITVWSKTDCVYCQLAKALLEDNGFEYEEKIIESVRFVPLLVGQIQD